MRSISPKKPSKKTDREQTILFGLIDLYLKSHKPVGSQTLQENGFESFSSATIRNYFNKLETLGFLKQPHPSGGRVPTPRAFRKYADSFFHEGILDSAQGKRLEEGLKLKGRSVRTLLHESAEILSELSQCAVFISAPRFDQDYIQEIRLLSLDTTRLLSILITDFGLIRTETIYIEHPISASFLSKCEQYFLWKMNRGPQLFFDTEQEETFAQKIYNEVIVRYVVSHAPFSSQDILRCGFSRLLSYPEFNDASSLVNALTLLEDKEQMKVLLQECCHKNELTYWIGSELNPLSSTGAESAVIAIPYYINQTVAGSIGLLGPVRLPYRQLFGILQHYSGLLSQALTESAYKFKLTFRQSIDQTTHRINYSTTLLENQQEKQHD